VKPNIRRKNSKKSTINPAVTPTGETLMFDPTVAREKRSALVAKMQTLTRESDGGKAWTPAKEKEFNALEREIITIDEQFAAMDRALDAAGAALSRGENPAAAAGGYASRAQAAAAIGAFAVRGDRSGFGFQASLTEGVDSGGVLVPSEIASEVLSVAKKYSPLRSICKVVPITTAASKYVQPVVVDGAATGWVGELDERTSTDAPKIEGVEFPDAEMYANVPVSVWLDEDTKAGEIIISELGKAFGRTEGKAFLDGSGTKQPVGLLHTAPTADADDTRAFGTLKYVVSGNASAITSDALINTVYDLLPEYRSNACWVLNSTTIALIRKLKDSEGRYLWSDSLAPGDPAMLLGFKVVEANNMPDVAADAIPVLFGDFMSGYCIVDRSMSLLRDPYSDKRYVQFYSRKRTSGNIVDSNAIRCLKIAA